MNTIIKITDLYKIYNETAAEVRAVDGVSLEFQQGEFSAIVGPSGSGKTTLLNLIGGLDTPTSGKIEIDGNDISALSEKQMTEFRLRNIGFIFQAYNLIPVLTAKENVSFVMDLQGKSSKETEQRAIELLKAVGLEGRENSRPAKLSGGQQQRVAVARALASKPKFILADEPTANLDSKSAENLLDIMERLNQEENITFIFSTHDPRIMAKAKRIIKLEDGRIVNSY
ncbi:MAG: ABC transporter ATP-binding protein [Prevotellaceae bacterium]|jgi:putative ABC transport system ATP-binding protein|nr:ABC transporter ATP-binding protein [Prevotellaceae bacterium]